MPDLLSPAAGARPPLRGPATGLAPARTIRRQVSHAVLLVVLASLLLSGGIVVHPASVPVASAPLDPLLAPGASAAAGAHLSGGPGADSVDTWVQSIRQTTLWAGADDDAPPLAQIAAWTYLQVIGPIQGSRVHVRALNGNVPAPVDAWVNVSDVSAALAPTAAPLPPTPTATVAPTPAPAVVVPPGPRKVTDAEPPDISAAYAVLVDGDSGQILFGRNAHGRVAPASLTKIVTAQVTLDHVADLNQVVTVDVDSRVMYDSTIMGLTPGMSVSVRALLYGLMLPSGNDAAIALAEYVGGSQAGFVDMMNARVRELGLQDSHFMNPHGLDADGHYSSPYDMVMLARRGMQSPAFAALAAAKSWQGEGFSLTNLNKMLWLYPGADGVKVGYTDNSGRAIVASATVGGHRVYVGLMRAPDMLNDCTALFNYAFNNYAWP